MLARRAWLLTAAVAACDFSGAKGTSTDAAVPPIDGELVDAMLDAPMIDGPPPDPNCFGTTPLTYVCLAALPAGDLVIDSGSAGSIDTNTSPLCVALRAGQGNYCVVAARTISIDRRLGSSGSRPLMFVATAGDITIGTNGNIDASSGFPPSSPTQMGPGATRGPCPTLAAAPNTAGGAGGSLGSKGGDGGAGTGAATGGTATDLVMLDSLRGGCPGQPGRAPGGAIASPGGLGGGVVAFVTTGQIVVSGIINASGGGGSSTTIDGGGGGGGGSGGVILFDAPTFTLNPTGVVFAEGAGGGGGSIFLGDGTPGESAAPAMVGAGGAGGGTAGSGGNGSSGGNGVAGSVGTGATPSGGGGGGGGAGIIRATDPTPPTGAISPPLS